MPVGVELFATSDQTISEEWVRALSSDLSGQLGADRFSDYDGRGAVILVRKADHHLLPEQLPAAESVLSVRLCTSFYAEGYERGSWHEIASVIEFLRHKLPHARVWYGPDGTDHVDLITLAYLDKMWEYWSLNGGRPYNKRSRLRNELNAVTTNPEPPPLAGFRVQLASDVIRDGLGLELLRADRVVAEVFRCDANRSLTVTTFDQNIPLTAMEAFIAMARVRLADFEDGSPLPAAVDRPVNRDPRSPEAS